MESPPEPTPPPHTTRECKKDRKNQRDSRARAAASAKENTNNGAAPEKRRRDSLCAADGRPATRLRTDHCPDDDSSNDRGDPGEEHSDDAIKRYVTVRDPAVATTTTILLPALREKSGFAKV
ncbi:hypothetical protein DFH09DRAFT_1075860 [Mycena vulgaris]|nr:hypothetical protein DFH09DRAFT_1075860 [Mycena vulgaris]